MGIILIGHCDFGAGSVAGQNSIPNQASICLQRTWQGNCEDGVECEGVPTRSIVGHNDVGPFVRVFIARVFIRGTVAVELEITGEVVAGIHYLIL